MNQKVNASLSELNVIKDILIGADLQMIQDRFEALAKTIQDLENSQQQHIKNMESQIEKRLQTLENNVNSKETTMLQKIKSERNNLSTLLAQMSTKLKED